MKTQNEEWKSIAECNGEYHISNHGRVKSLKFGKERILKPLLKGRKNHQYYSVSISCLGKSRVTKIHRLVAIYFIDNPESKSQVNHKDGNKYNNHVDNLEWMTSKENVQHAWENGLCENIRIAATTVNSKPVIDVLTNKRYDSLTLACKDIDEPYMHHYQRMRKNYYNKRFIFITDGNR
jgi:hypothetical protein